MVREPEELVQMRRVLGAQLAACRQAAQLSQGQLARAVVVDRTTVAHIEKGRSRADERFWMIVDEKCRAGGELLAGFHAWQVAKQQHEIRVRETELAQARARVDDLRATLAPQGSGEPDRLVVPGAAGAPGAGAAGGPELGAGMAGLLAWLSWVGSLAKDEFTARSDEVIDQLVRLLSAWVGGMNRRELLRLLQLLGRAVGIAAVAPVVAGLDPDEQQRLVRAIATPSRVDEQVINHFEAMLRYCKRQDDAFGARAVLKTAIAQRNLVHDLLQECPAGVRPHLLSVYSDMSTSVGYYYFDLNDFDSASYYCDQARAAAHDAGNIELSVYALCEMSDHASWQGKVHAAIDFAAAAQNLLRKTDDPLMRVCAAQRAGTAYAADGQHDACMVEFDKAQDGLASIGQVPAESLGYFLNEGYLARMKSESLLRLGKPREAATTAEAGLSSYDRSFVDGYAVCVLHLGNARLQSGEIAEAARVVGEAAGLAARTRSARLTKELRTTRARMTPWQDTQVVKALDDQLEAYGLMPGAAT